MFRSLSVFLLLFTTALQAAESPSIEKMEDSFELRKRKKQRGPRGPQGERGPRGDAGPLLIPHFSNITLYDKTWPLPVGQAIPLACEHSIYSGEFEHGQSDAIQIHREGTYLLNLTISGHCIRFPGMLAIELDGQRVAFTTNITDSNHPARLQTIIRVEKPHTTLQIIVADEPIRLDAKDRSSLCILQLSE